MTRLLRWIYRARKILYLAAAAAFIAAAFFFAGVVISRRMTLHLPVPTGPYAVGRMEYDWVDQSRMDPLAGQPNTPRELAVWVWYPAEAGGATYAPYMPPAWAQARAKDQGLGYLIETDLNRIQTHSYEGISLAAAPSALPVLIMEPGMGPSVPDYTVFAENLASHGYVVVGINPTYTSNLIVFPNGRVVTRSLTGAIPDSDTGAQLDADANRIQAVWDTDVRFVMDQAQKLDASPSSPFYNRLDLAKIGVWGHSFGGATAYAVCQQEPRCKAGADLDGTLFGAELKATVSQPFMFITEDYRKSCDANCASMHQGYQSVNPGDAYFLSIAEAGHFNFTDLPLRQVPLLRPFFIAAGLEGPIDPARGLQITNAYLVAFFDRYLKGTSSPLLEGPSALYPEVTFAKR
ncbi:MAG: family membership [Chloroflexi bacterium]|nr:family membership [Chloroflexota bacterium]